MIPFLLQVPPPTSPSFWSHVYEIVAVAVLLLAQTFWQRRTGSRAMEGTVASLRTAINVLGQNADAGFVRSDKAMNDLGHRIELWAEKTNGIGKSVDGLLSREQTRLEDDAKLTRRGRR